MSAAGTILTFAQLTPVAQGIITQVIKEIGESESDNLIKNSLARLVGQGLLSEKDAPDDPRTFVSIEEQILNGVFEKTRIKDALDKFKSWTEKGSIRDALTWFSDQPVDYCGLSTLRNGGKGEGKGTVAKNNATGKEGDPNFRHAIVYFMHPINGKPPFPKLKDESDPDNVLSLFEEAVNFWELKLKMNITSTGNESGANLIIRGEPFGAGVSKSVVALTDIGPLFTKKCLLKFDTGESPLTSEEFKYTVAHEFGHALGIKHADVPRTGALMSPVMDLSNGVKPTEADLKAAVKKGWKRS